MRIRRITKKDLKELAKLDAKIFGGVIAAQSYKVFQHFLKNQVYGASLLAEENGEMIGAIFAEKRMTFTPNTAHILSFFVKKEFRGKGIGRLLMKKCLSAMKKAGIKEATLTVEMKNKNAASLYKRQGFRLFRLMYLKKF